MLPSGSSTSPLISLMTASMALVTPMLNMLSLMETVRRVWVNWMNTRLMAAKAKMVMVKMRIQRFMGVGLG